MQKLAKTPQKCPKKCPKWPKMRPKRCILGYFMG